MDSATLQSSYGAVVNIGHTFYAHLSKRIHATSVAKGFYDDPVVMDKVAAKIALIHSECTEVLEALRKNQGADKVTEEIADINIRTLDLHAWLVELQLATDDLDETMAAKMEKNDARPPKHGHAWG